MSLHTLSANTTLNKIIVGTSLLGEGSVLETCTKKKKKKFHKMHKINNVFTKNIKCKSTFIYNM